MEKSTLGRRRRFLYLSLLSNLGMLFFFKYVDFTLLSFEFIHNALATFFGGPDATIQIPLWRIVLPVGISFYTFQTLSYSIDVYQGKRTAETSFWTFALYVSFFPQLVAGPIERSTHLLPQFKEPKSFDYLRVVDGLKLMMWGFFKKLVIADRLAIYVNEVYGTPWEYQGFTFLVATYFFAFQIYCDFSGYSDIAIGSAKVFGYDLMENFNRPYLSRSIPEFWRRWHISLSTWFRDYVYVPLGGNRVGRRRLFFNLYFVFLVSGLWHGANATFLVWGALHGVYQISSLVSQEWRRRLRERLKCSENNPCLVFLQIIFTFHLVCLAWVFFRAKHIGDAYYILMEIGQFSFSWAELIRPLGKVELFYAGVALLFLGGVEILQYRKMILRQKIASLPFFLRWPLYLSLPTVTLMFGVFAKQEFLYFQF